MATKEDVIKLKITAITDELRYKLLDAQSQVKRFNKDIELLQAAVVGFGGIAVFAGLAEGIKHSYEAAEQAESSIRKLEAVLKATGNTSGLSAEEMINFANELSSLTGVSAGEIRSMETALGTFRNVSGDTFRQGIKLALDMSSVFGVDLNTSVKMLGKALNDPINGMTALRRAGVQLTSQQQEQIKTLVKSGHGLEAQKIILDELSHKFAGVAEAGAMVGDKLDVSMKKFNTAVGKIFQPAGDAMLTMLNEIVKGATNAANAINKLLNPPPESLNDKLKATNAEIAQYTKMQKENSGDKNSFDYRVSTERLGQLLPYRKKLEDEIKKQPVAKTVDINPVFSTPVTHERQGAKKTDSYGEQLKNIRNQLFDNQNEKDAGQALKMLGISKESPVYDEAKNIIIDFNKQIRDIELSDAKNKENLIIETKKLYIQKAKDLEIQGTQLVNEDLAKQQRDAEKQQSENALDAKINNFKTVADAQKQISDEAKKQAEQTQRAWQHAFERIFDHTLTWKQRMIGAVEEIVMAELKMLMVQSLTPLAGAGLVGTMAKIGLAFAGTFADGGIIPGGYSNPVPIIAHGSEMVLNPSQQSNLFDMLSGGQSGGKSGGSNYITYAPVFQSLDPAHGHKLFTQWMKETGINQVQGAIKNNTNGMRTTVRSA